MKNTELIGLRNKFAEIVAFHGFEVSNGRRRKLWVCRCDCGKIWPVEHNHWKNGCVQSCGCRKRELIGAAKTIHGMSKTPEYKTWLHMKDRCLNSKNKDFDIYGGRGIEVCERWMSFENFLSDMGLRPSNLHSIDRIDYDGNYEPCNCRWATPQTQMRNTKKNRLYSMNGKSMCLAAWTEPLGVRPGSREYKTIWYRLRSGWTLERALSEAPKKSVIHNVRGVVGTVAELCRHFGVPDVNARNRMAKGWSVEDAVTRPVA